MSTGAPGWDLQQIIKDPAKHDELVRLARNRRMQSLDFFGPYHEKFVRMQKIYSNITDKVQDVDEPNAGIAYAYGIVEDLVSKITEPIIQMRPPCRVQAKRADQERAAENFATITSNYFRTSRYQIEYTESTRELIIVGNTWERDNWSNDWVRGKKWARVQKPVTDDDGNVVLDDGGDEILHDSLEEVEADYPERVGYHTTFPAIFDILPEPGPACDRDLRWLIEQVVSEAIEELQTRKYADPNTGELTNVFDFSLMFEEIGDHVPGQIQPIKPEDHNSTGDEYRRAIAGQLPEETGLEMGDIDKVHLDWVWEKNRFWVVANGAYVVAYQENVFQVPRIPYRLKIYTPLKGFLYGTGAIEPVESNFYELNDIHKLAMRNWVRIVNKMVAYNENAVPFVDDFKPRAGGKIRVRTSTSVRNEIVSLDQQDVTGTMLLQQDSTKGNLERAIAVADFAPGKEGTKQTHKTLGGLMEIARSMGQRITTIRRMVLAAYQDQMWFMEKLYSQFQFDKVPYQVHGPDGATSMTELNMWDIYTEGVGFDFVIEYDPSFGDDALLRNQMMVLLDQCVTYEQARIQLGHTDAAKANLEDVMRRIFKAFGWIDTSKILERPNGQIDADQEFELMIQGIPQEPKEGENLASHLIDHTIQINSPKYMKGVASGDITERSHLLMKAHLEATKRKLFEIAVDPKKAADARRALNLQKEVTAGSTNPASMSPSTATAFPDGAPFSRPELQQPNQGSRGTVAPFV